jgi:hypothetical protein
MSTRVILSSHWQQAHISYVQALLTASTKLLNFLTACPQQQRRTTGTELYPKPSPDNKPKPQQQAQKADLTVQSFHNMHVAPTAAASEVQQRTSAVGGNMERVKVAGGQHHPVSQTHVTYDTPLSIPLAVSPYHS